MSVLQFLLMGSLATHSLCTQPLACTVKDGGDDTCEFLQGPVGVSIKRSGTEEHAELGIAASSKKKESAMIGAAVAKGQDQEGGEKVEKHAEHIATVHSSSGATDSRVDGKGWPGDLWHKLTGIIGNSLNLESSLEQLKKEVDNFEKVVVSAMKELKTNYKTESITDIQAKVKKILALIHKEAQKVAEHISDASTTFKDGVAKALPQQFAKPFEAALEKAAMEGGFFSRAIFHAETKIGDTNITALCTHAEIGIKDIKKKSLHFVESATGLKFDALKDSLKDVIAKLPKQIKDEVDKFIVEASAAGNKMIGNLPKVAQEIEEGMVAAFKDKCPQLAKKPGKATRSVGFSAVMIGAAYWLV
jgi:hypothetical protein